MNDEIIIRGAREHNLKNIDVTLPKNTLICFTGLSGSGKSSLAFNTIFAEGRRRYLQSLSAYARQFLGTMQRPDVDSIDGLSPAVSIEAKGVSKSPRSTVATTTEIYDHLRLLFARIGHPHCPICGKAIGAQTIDQILDQVLLLPDEQRFIVAAPMVRGRKGEYTNLFADLRRDGFSRVLVDGTMKTLDEDIILDKKFKHDILVVVDRLKMREGLRQRLADSVESALRLTDGLVDIILLHEGQVENYIDFKTYSERFSCTECGTSLPEMEPHAFSFNVPQSACPLCQGLGVLREVDASLIVTDINLSVDKGALAVKGVQRKGGYWDSLIKIAAAKYKVPTNKPWHTLNKHQQDVLMYGPKGGDLLSMSWRGIRGGRRNKEVSFKGLVEYLNKRYQDTESESLKNHISALMRDHTCPECDGARLRPESLAVTITSKINGKIVKKNISQFTYLDIESALDYMNGLVMSEPEAEIAKLIYQEITDRLSFLMSVNLSYIQLNRVTGTISEGEFKRLTLASRIGNSLTGCVFVIDEPSSGLSPNQVENVLFSLQTLVDRGNTVIITDHSRILMGAKGAHIVDIGEKAGMLHGGNIVAQGTLQDIMDEPKSLTGQYLSGKRKIKLPTRGPIPDKCIEIKGAAEHNLQNIDVKFPIGRITCVTGASGSGKSTLITDILYRAAGQKLNNAREKPGLHKSITGLNDFDRCVYISADPIGRSPRSNPATYIGAFDEIRKIYAKLPLSRARGWTASRFSFNVNSKTRGGGRCEACEGLGGQEIKMLFLAPVWQQCPICKGRQFSAETLTALYKGKSIADVLDMSVEEAFEFFDAIPPIKRRLKALMDCGVGYIPMKQTSLSISSGENRRIRIAKELARTNTGNSLFICDEIANDLHFYDIEVLSDALVNLRKSGNTIICTTHQMELVAGCADYVVELGDEPDDDIYGGKLIATGTPEEILKNKKSMTGKYLKELKLLK